MGKSWRGCAAAAWSCCVPTALIAPSWVATSGLCWTRLRRAREQQHLANRCQHLLLRHRLLEIEPRAERPGEFRLVQHRADDDGHRVEGGVGAQALEEFPAVHGAHHHVQDDDGGRLALDGIEGALAVGDGGDPVSFGDEVALKELQYALVVVDDEDGRALGAAKVQRDLFHAAVLAPYLESAALGRHQLGDVGQPVVHLAEKERLVVVEGRLGPQREGSLLGGDATADGEGGRAPGDERGDGRQDGLLREGGIGPHRDGTVVQRHLEPDVVALGHRFGRRQHPAEEVGQGESLHGQPQALHLALQATVLLCRCLSLTIARPSLALDGLPPRPEDTGHRQEALAVVALELAQAGTQLDDDVVDLVAVDVAVRQDAVRAPLLVIARDVGARLELLEGIEHQIAEGAGDIVVRPRGAYQRRQRMALQVGIVVEMRQHIAHHGGELVRHAGGLVLEVLNRSVRHGPLAENWRGDGANPVE